MLPESFKDDDGGSSTKRKKFHHSKYDDEEIEKFATYFRMNSYPSFMVFLKKIKDDD